MSTTKETTPIRHLMPERYTRLIAAETGAGTSTISDTVVNERINSDLWNVIERLAKGTDATKYAERMAFLQERARKFKQAVA